MNQQTAFGILKTGRNVFLTGSAGTGKTYLLNKYIQYLRERNITPAIVAPTGIAASHIGGMTIHSFFGIGIRENIDEYFLEILMQRPRIHRRLNKLKVLIIDEVSMLSPELFASVDKILRAFKSVDAPFGGVQLVLSGDFFQLPPVSKEAREKKFAWQSKSWEEANLKACYLEEKFRQSDEKFIKILDEIRAGEVSEGSMEVFRSCYKKKLEINFRATKLYTHNVDVDRINKKELESLSGELKIFKSWNKGSKKNIEKILKSSLVVEELEIKKGALVIFIKNNYERGYINGTLGEVVDFDELEGMPIVKICSGKKIRAKEEDWTIENNKGEIKAVVNQVPLRLAWALTVHKSQGMTLDAAEIDLSKTFEVGQGYVALSRIKSVQGLRLMGLNKIALQVSDLALDIDKKIQRLSRLNSLKFESFTKEEKEKMFNNFMIKMGGTVNENEIKENKKKLNEEVKVNVSVKENTLEITKKLLAEKKSVLEISKERGLSDKTIFGHIQKISELYPDFDLVYLKPEDKLLESVAKAVLDIKKKNNPDDFLDDGKIRLKAIFIYLNEKVSYEEIKLAMIFISACSL